MKKRIAAGRAGVDALRGRLVALRDRLRRGSGRTDREIWSQRKEAAVFVSVALLMTTLIVLPPALNPKIFYRPDNQLHTSIAFSAINTGIPPDCPYFAGFPLLYYWLYDTTIAVDSYAAGIQPQIALYATNCVGFIGLLAMIWLLAKSMGGSPWAGLAAIVFFALGLNALTGMEAEAETIMSGNLVDPHLLLGVHLGLWPSLKGIGDSSILIGFMTGQAMDVSLAFIAGGFYCISEYRKRGGSLYLVSLFLCGIGALGFHPTTGIYFAAAVGAYAALDFLLGNRRAAAVVLLTVVVSAVVLLPYFIGIMSGKSGDLSGSIFRKVASIDSLAGSKRLSLTSIVYTALKNRIGPRINLTLLFAVAGCVICRRRISPVIVGALAVFLFVAIFIVTPGGSYKNTILLMMPLSVLAAFSFESVVLLFSSQKARWGLFALLILALSPTNLMTVIAYSNDPASPVNEQSRAEYGWIQANTPPDSVIVASTRPRWDFLGKSGRVAYFYDKFWRLHGYPADVAKERSSLMKDMTSGKDLRSNADRLCSLGRPVYVVITPDDADNAKDLQESYSQAGRYQMNEVAAGDGKSFIFKVLCGS